MRDRTADLFAASEALSQLSYSPAYLNIPLEEIIQTVILNNWPNSY